MLEWDGVNEMTATRGLKKQENTEEEVRIDMRNFCCFWVVVGFFFFSPQRNLPKGYVNQTVVRAAV